MESPIRQELLDPVQVTREAAVSGRTASERSWHPVRRIVHTLISGVRCGTLHVRLPNGRLITGNGSEPGPEATILLHRWWALWRLALRGDIGLGESYRDGDWSSPDLASLLTLGLRNEAPWNETLSAAWPLRLLFRLGHRRRDNTRRGSRRNIAFHYDLGNDFYRQWLDSDMIYSSALYRDGTATLEQAQAEKLTRVVELLDLPAAGGSMRILEIGCGWGALACALGRTGAKVTGITLSKQQLAHAREQSRRKGLADCVDLRLQDYRDVDGQFDRIVSIEMIEAVGEQYWPTYFSTLRDHLRPDGVAIIQSITIHDDHFDSYRRNADFIQRHVFPGGMLPSPSALRREAKRAGLVMTEAVTFGSSYAATLVEWRRRFHQAWPDIARLGFDDTFRRLWDYYFCYCEAGFRCGRVDVGLYRLTHSASEPA